MIGSAQNNEILSRNQITSSLVVGIDTSVAQPPTSSTTNCAKTHAVCARCPLPTQGQRLSETKRAYAPPSELGTTVQPPVTYRSDERHRPETPAEQQVSRR
jgi:hypothetical protein